MINKRCFYCILPVYLYSSFERWLKKQSEKGYSLVSNHGIRYTFLQQKPKTKHYFIFHRTGITRNQGRFSLTLRHWNLIKVYGVPAKKSPLNVYAMKNHPHPIIIEISPEKFESADYAELRRDRRNLHFAETVYDSGLLLLSTVILYFATHNVIVRTIMLILSCGILLHIILSLVFFLIDKTRDGDAS